MTDIAADSTVVGRAQIDSAARIAKRYRAERRFKAYGIGALCITAIFLVLLFVDILGKGLPAFTEHTLVFTLKADQAALDPQKTNDPKVLIGGNYDGLIRDQLRAMFPNVKARADRTKLVRLLSSGAADDFRNWVAADPALIGQDVTVPVLLSDDADQYLKGYQTDIQTFGSEGSVTIMPAGDKFALTFTPKPPLGLLPADVLRTEGGAFRITEINGATITAEPIGTAPSVTPGKWDMVRFSVPESNRRVDDQEALWLESLKSQGVVERGFAWRFLTSGDSREPELAGVRGALTGTILTLLVTLLLCLPIGVAAAIYLEEFATRNKFTQIIEVNINNLAAVPSIVFGLLGLAMFLNFFGLPRSAPLVGGLVLALLVLPTIIIASRAALRAVPPSIKEAALGVGASHQQAVFHHVLPLAMPGIMTGTIIGMAHALGETAPLLMIGMVAFIVDIPHSVTDAATVLPVQIYLWSDLPENAFQAKTAGAIIVLLVFLFVMNAAAILVRRRFERRW
ncbi:hypothetical protein BH10PSE7_BH10PSE7_18860 [soil metagenome]